MHLQIELLVGEFKLRGKAGEGNRRIRAGLVIDRWKLKILRVMLEKPNEAFTKYALEKATKLKPVDVRTNVEALVEIGWIKKYPYQPTTYKINLKNELVKHFLRFSQEIRHL